MYAAERYPGQSPSLPTDDTMHIDLVQCLLFIDVKFPCHNAVI